MAGDDLLIRRRWGGRDDADLGIISRIWGGVHIGKGCRRLSRIQGTKGTTGGFRRRVRSGPYDHFLQRCCDIIPFWEARTNLRVLTVRRGNGRKSFVEELRAGFVDRAAAPVAGLAGAAGLGY